MTSALIPLVLFHITYKYLFEHAETNRLYPPQTILQGCIQHEKAKVPHVKSDQSEIWKVSWILTMLF